jgi:hypothetical protein
LLIQPVCSLAKVVYLGQTKKLAHINIIERFVAVVRSKNASPTWGDVEAALFDFDRAGLRGQSALAYHPSRHLPPAKVRALLGFILEIAVST